MRKAEEATLSKAKPAMSGTHGTPEPSTPILSLPLSSMVLGVTLEPSPFLSLPLSSIFLGSVLGFSLGVGWKGGVGQMPG